MILRISLNGVDRTTGAATLADLLPEAGFDLAGPFACAVNREFVPRSRWAERPLRDGDRVDVISAVTGG